MNQLTELSAMNADLSTAQPQVVEPSVSPVHLQKIEGHAGSGAALFGGNISLIKDVKVRLGVFVGHADISVGELFALQEHSVVKLDSLTDSSVEIRLDGRVIARGSLVVVGDNLGVSVEEILPAYS
jgi:flagellar motor switch protein FliN/FliY